MTTQLSTPTTDGAVPRRARRVFLSFPVILLSALLACGSGDETPVTQPDSISADSVLSVQLAETADSATTAATTQELAAVIDSLRAQNARLESRLNSLQDAPVPTSGLLPLIDEGARDQAADVEGLDAGRRVQETAQDVRHFTLRAIWAAILLFVAWLFIRGASWVLDVLSERSAQRRLFFKKLIPIMRLLVWALVLFYVVSAVFEVDRAGLLAGTAALGVGIGFAAQGVLKNVFGGLMIIFDQPFQVGDKINVGGTYGEVVSIGMRATRMVTPDDNLVSVPNAQIIEGQVANANAGALDCQVVVHLYLPGWVDVAKAKAIAMNAALNSQYAYLDKPVVVNVKDEFDRIFLTHLVVKVYVIDTRYEFALASDVTEAAKAEFMRTGMMPPMTAALDWAVAGQVERNWSGTGGANG